MSYIQIDFAGKLRGFKFNQGALMTFRKKVDLNDIDATSAYAIFWAGLIANARVKDEELDVTFEQVCDAVDELDPALIEQVSRAFMQSRAYEKLLAAQPDEEETKKKSLETEMNTPPTVTPSDAGV